MREAKVQDHWRHVYANHYPKSLISFRFSNINGLGDGVIHFRGGISAICGGNGVGKSTVLDAIAGTLISPVYANNHVSHGRFTSTSLEAGLLIGGANITKTLTFSNDNYTIDGDLDCEITHLNPATLALNVMSFLTRTKNFAEVLESLEPRIATPNELAQLSYIVGKQYESLEVYEIEDYSLERDVDDDNAPDSDDINMPFPYFKVVSGGIGYSSGTMGLGELSLFILVWMLNRVSEDSILLIEEPETYISPSSQKKFMNHMARISDIKHLWIVITTHSPSIVEHIPLDKITLLSRGGLGVTIIDKPTKFQINEVLDQAHSYSGVLLVEDPVAQTLLRSLLIRLDLDIYQRYEILIAEDEGTLTRLKSCFPTGSSWLEIAVIYDGDQRGKQGDGKIPHGFLPTTSSPEVLLKETTLNNLQRLSDTINRSIDDLRIVLDGLQGRDSHDWLEELSKRLAMNKNLLIDVIVGVCLDTDANARAQAIELVTTIRSAFQ